MSPSSRGRGRRAQPDPLVIALRRRRRRERTKAQHRRFARFVLGGVVGGLVFLAVSGFTGAAVWMSSCDLKSLRPVQVGSNAPGSLIFTGKFVIAQIVISPSWSTVATPSKSDGAKMLSGSLVARWFFCRRSSDLRSCPTVKRQSSLPATKRNSRWMRSSSEPSSD